VVYVSFVTSQAAKTKPAAGVATVTAAAAATAPAAKAAAEKVVSRCGVTKCCDWLKERAT